MPIFESIDDILRKYEFPEQGLQPMFQEGSQAQTGAPDGGLQDAFHDAPQIPRTRLRNEWNKPEPQTASKYNPYGDRGLTGRQLAGIRESFTGNDPLSCIEDEAARKQIESIAARFDVEESERIKKAVALAHYYSMGHREATGFIFDNLDAAIEEFEGKPMSVEQAYESVRELFTPPDKGILAKTFETPAVAAATSGVLNVAKTTTNTFNFAVGKSLKAAQATDFILLNFLGGVAHLAGFEETGKFLSEASNHLPDWGKQYEDAMHEAMEQTLGTMIKWEQQNMNVPENWVTNSDSVGDWLANAGLSLIAYAPELAVQIGLGVATGGTSTLGLVYGINGYYDIKGDMPDVSEGEALLYGLGIGLINSVLEKVSLGIAEGKVAKDVASHGIKKGVTRVLAYLGVSAGMEGAEEGLEEFSENLLDIAMGLRGDTKDWTAKRWLQEELRGIPEAFFLGFTTGGVMAAPKVGVLKERARQNEALRSGLENRKAELAVKDTLTDGEKEELSAVTAALDCNDPDQIRKAAASVVLNTVIRTRQEREAARKRVSDAEARLAAAQQELDDVSARPAQNAGLRNTAISKYRAAKQELEAARAELAESRKELVKVAPEEETEEEEAARKEQEWMERDQQNAKAGKINYDYRKRLGWEWRDTRDKAEDIVKRYFPGFRVVTLRSADELPEAARAEAARRKDDSGKGIDLNKIRGFTSTDGKTVYIMANRVPPSEVGKVIGHEIIGHHGLRAAFGEKYDSFLDAVYRAHKDEVDKLAAAYNTKTDQVDGRRYLTEDFLANLADAEVKPSWWREFIGQILSFLREFFPDMQITQMDIEAALSRGARAARKGANKGGSTRFALIGEQGVWRMNARRNIDNLETARDMEIAGSSAREIWLATGWERGADRQWRMELPDLHIKTDELTQGGNYNALIDYDGTLDGYVDAPEIFAAYPEMKKTGVKFRLLPLDTAAQYNPNDDTIVFNRTVLVRNGFDVLNDMAADMKEAKTPRDAAIMQANIQENLDSFTENIQSTLIHEVQHKIQEEEGFAKGTNPETAEYTPDVLDPKYSRAAAKLSELEERYDEVGDEFARVERESNFAMTRRHFDAVMHYYAYGDEKSLETIRQENAGNPSLDYYIELLKEHRDLFKEMEQAKADAEIAHGARNRYHRYSGEVESRNTEERATWNEEQRQNTPPSESEDVPRSDQIVRFSMIEDDNDLIAVHNVSEQKLRDAIKLGALPVPSLGIISAKKSDFTDYGRITLIADKDLIDPKKPKNKVFNADIYSVRRPEIQREYTEQDFDRALEVIAPHELHESDSHDSIQWLVKKHRSGMTSHDFVDDLKNSDAVRNWYVDTRDGEETFEDWWIRVAEPELDLHPDERIFDGYTNSGRRRYLPANLETIVKLMTRKVKDSEGFFYGVGNIRANMARQFKSIAEIQKNRDKIVSGEDYKKIKEEVTQEFNELLDHISAAITGNNISRSSDTAADLLRAMAEGPNKPANREWLTEALGDFSEPIYQDMADFLLKLRDLPTPLFEAKPQRAVYLNEFKAAVVPESTANDILNALRDAGVEVYTYASDDARKATLQYVTSEHGLRFSLAEYSEDDQRDITAFLKPKHRSEAFVEPSEVKAYLAENGFGDIEENDAWSFYQQAGMQIKEERRKLKAAQKKRRDKERDEWIYQNDLLYQDAVDYGGSDFKIIPSFRFDDNDEWSGTFIADSWRKHGKKRPQGKKESGLKYHDYLRKREAEMTSEHQTGITSDDLAKYIARKRGGDELDIEEQIIEHFRNLNRPKLWDMYYKFKKDENWRNEKEEREAREAYEENMRAAIEDEAVEIIMRGEPLTEEWATENKAIFDEVFKLLFQTDAPKSASPSKIILESVNEALKQKEGDASQYARAYKEAREASWNEYRKTL